METTRYELKSIPGKFVDVPADCGNYAENIVKMILNNDPERALESIKKNYPGSEGVLSKTEKLIQNPDSTIDQDKLYVRICLQCNFRRLRLMDADSKPEDELEKARLMDIVLYDLSNELYYKSINHT